MQSKLTCILAVLGLPLSFGCPASAAAPSPAALLRGVEAARTQHASLRVRLNMSYVAPPPKRGYELLVEWDEVGRRRAEIVGGDRGHELVIRDGDEIRVFQQRKHADLELHGRQDSTGAGAKDLTFDPRILGLSDFMPYQLTIKKCLWYENSESLEVVGQEKLHGVDVWRVSATRKNATSDYWIEEPSFRVHRRVTEWPGTRIEIDSEFDEANPESSFPSRVVAKRVTPESRYERIYTVTGFVTGVEIPPERFTLKAMDLPIGTPVSDYRVSRIIGYWNGEGLSASPVEARGGSPAPPTPPASPQAQGLGKLLLVATNVVVLLVLAALIWWRRRATLAGS